MSRALALALALALVLALEQVSAMPGTASEATRPPFLQLIADDTLKNVIAKYGIPPDVEALYRRFIAHESVVRRFWSRPPLAMVHGDSHIGNCFFRADGRAGFYDMQCVAAEHGMRDITYNLVSGFDADELGACEQSFVRLYCDTLNPVIEARGHAPLTFDDAWFMYRLHVVWAMASFIISAGTSDLMDARVAQPVLSRIYKAAQRLKTATALDDVIEGRR